MAPLDRPAGGFACGASLASKAGQVCMGCEYGALLETNIPSTALNADHFLHLCLGESERAAISLLGSPHYLGIRRIRVQGLMSVLPPAAVKHTMVVNVDPFPQKTWGGGRVGANMVLGL